MPRERADFIGAKTTKYTVTTRYGGFFYVGVNMPIDTFQWRTQAAPVGNFSHNVRSAQFGDGYKQISSNGLNSVTQSWQLVYTGHPTVTESLLSFLNAHVIRAFFWTPPGGRKNLFRVKSDSITVSPLSRNVFSVSFTFEQAFGV